MPPVSCPSVSRRWARYTAAGPVGGHERGDPPARGEEQTGEREQEQTDRGVQGHRPEYRQGVEVMHPIGIAEQRQAGDHERGGAQQVRDPIPAPRQGGGAQQRQAGGGCR